jgi:hypothetical protein
MRFLAQRSIVKAGLAAAALSVATGVTVAAPAQAALSDCSDYRMCVFEDWDGGGRYIEFQDGTSDLSQVFGGVMNDNTSYVWNRTREPWCVYQHKDEGGLSLMVQAGDKGTLRNMYDTDENYHWNNKVSSVRPALHIVPPRNPHADYYVCVGGTDATYP